MNFCPRCGAMLRTKNALWLCACGYTGTPKQRIIIEKSPAKETIVVGDQNNDVLAAYDHTCSRCQHDKARLVSKGVWYTDEDEHIAFVCGKCGHHDVFDAKTT